PGLGCPHDYALTPQDMMKISNANVMIINGLGMEEFIGLNVLKINPNIKIIDSSEGIKDLIKLSDEHHNGEIEEDHEEIKEDHHHHNEHSEFNPHLFASPMMAQKVIINIASNLSRIIPDKREIFEKNAKEYIKRLQIISDDFKKKTENFKNKKIIQPHGVFDYFARDFGLEIIATLQPHGHELSSSEIITLIKIIEKEKPIAIISEYQYSDKIAKMLSDETKIPHIKLDPVASGPENPPLNFYEERMKKNFQILEKIMNN
ncbi:MAG TPA: zinc ABC transporter substrate-binding protein, partial [Victivallales bacterium]|nr:zinc ABC transporter substrate-binding protein [Victivallales bacterium]